MKSSKITFINIIAILGFAILAVTSFLGALFISKGSLGYSIMMAILSVFLPAMVLYGAIKCKGVENDFHKWKKVEITLAILFWFLAIPGAYFSMHFFNIVGSRDDLNELAQSDIAAINGLFGDYEKFETNAIANTRTSLENALGQPCDDIVAAYFQNAGIHTPEQLDNWLSLQRNLLLGTRGIDGFSYIGYKENVDSVTTNWLNHITSGNIMYIANHAADLEVIAPDVASRLTENSGHGKLPVIEFKDGLYTLSNPGKSATFIAPQLSFSNHISSFSNVNILGVVFTVIVLLMIYLDYIMAYRSDKIAIDNFGNPSDNLGGNKLF